MSRETMVFAPESVRGRVAAPAVAVEPDARVTASLALAAGVVGDCGSRGGQEPLPSAVSLLLPLVLSLLLCQFDSSLDGGLPARAVKHGWFQVCWADATCSEIAFAGVLVAQSGPSSWS